MTSFLRPLGEERVASGSFLHLDRLSFATPDGTQVERDVVRHPGAVAFLPVDGDEVVLVRQYRVAVEEMVLEIPAGKLDEPGEDPLDAVRRECIEEIGFRPRSIRSLGWIYASPGFTDEQIHLYEVGDLEPDTIRPDGIEEEHAEIIRMNFEEAVRQVRDGLIVDAKTRLTIALVALDRA